MSRVGRILTAFLCSIVALPIGFFLGFYLVLLFDHNYQHGNISADPKFVNPSRRNYRVGKGSPVINAGTTSAPDLPTKDIAGHPRVVNGMIDIGAYEY